MTNALRSYLGLVEIADYEYLEDRYGVESAHRLREDFYQRLQHWIRPQDQSRILKNNRFLTILKGVGTESELELATTKLARLFEAPYDLFGQLTSIEIHAGFALLDGSTTDTTVAMKEARMALRQARRSEQFHCVYDHEQHQLAEREDNLAKALEQALDKGELQLYYQPKLHAGFDNLVGAEALLRWHTSDQKVLTPAHFIDVAERNPVIRPITFWAIKSAVAQLRKWPDQLSVSVNVTPSLLLDDEILALIQDTLSIYDVKPERLTLEVTESIMVSNQEAMLQQLRLLRQIGVTISIDDFGTGYSSLAYFRDLPADEIKIDKSFVMAMRHSPKDRAIVKATIDLARNFDLKVVAEGVEESQIASQLTALGCDILQGFLYDRPLPLEEFEKRYLK